MTGRQANGAGFLSFLMLCFCASSALAQTEAELKKQLSAQGVTVVSNRAYLAAEGDLTKDLKEVSRMRRELVNATKTYHSLRAQIDEAEEVMTRMQNDSVQLNSQLANVSDTFTNNRLVGAINALQSQIVVVQAQKKKLDEQETETRAKASDAREAYLTHVLEMRTLADELEEKYAAIPEETTALLEQYNVAAKTTLTLAASPSFQQNLKKLTEAEASILSEAVPLRGESNTFHVDATINGKHRKEFTVDSGASMICLPYAVAKEFGVEPTPQDPVIALILADGGQVNAQLIKLASVRVGKFTINDVECAVLGPEAINAEPILGMSFLNNFKFEINAATSTLSMTQIDTPEANVTPRRKR
ncbi:TIGR02281 family clan AA aspartic protease [Planctomicrobium piriforme]|nr:TIGR02281 family clan AA aspartic protease [Planctomicrobium piriforme]